LVPDLPAGVNQPDGTVEVVDYDPAWPGRFEEERARLVAVAPGLFRSIEHVGSTAVPGMPAKPTIDILAVARSIEAVLGHLGPLAAAGYDHRPGSFPDDDRHLFFRKVRAGKRVAHLHVHEPASPQVDEYRLFLAFLRADPAAAARYAGLKRDLAARYADRRQLYVEAKHAEVDLLMIEARRWRATTAAAPGT
jgi:GrpB-like predicted nucleotidyltransferase (UPF0157 family)